MRVYILSLIYILLTLSNLRAQEEFIQPPSRYITKVPFKTLTGGIILLKAKLPAFTDSLNFILDTGSGGISLDSTTVVELGLKSELSDKTVRGIAGIRQVRFIYNQTMLLPGLKVDSLNFHINDYEVLSSAYGERIDGIVGYSFLSRYIIKINYDSSYFTVHSKGTLRYPKGGFLLKPMLVSIPIINMGIRDMRELDSRFYFDTGAGMCLLLSQEFAADSNFISPKRKWFNSQAEGLGGKASMKQGVVKQLKFGPYRFRNVPTFIFDDEYNVTQYPFLGGLIGNDLLRRFNTIINYEKKEIHLLPNSHFKDVFDYSYTGLGMYMVDGEVVIMDIMEGSPAEAAGFKSGDIVMAINHNFSKNIQAYKTMLQTPGEKVKFLVLREDGPQELVLRVKSVL